MVGESLIVRPTWSTEWAPEQLRIHKETLSQNYYPQEVRRIHTYYANLGIILTHQWLTHKKKKPVEINPQTIAKQQKRFKKKQINK